MARKRYPSDLTDKQWRIFSGYVPPPKDGGRPAEIERREIVNAILYVTTQGISCLGQSGTVLSRTAPCKLEEGLSTIDRTAPGP